MKLYKTIISLALLCINLYVQGCSHRYLVDKQELEQHPRGNITAVVTSDASYKFSDYGRGHIVDDTLIVGILENGVPARIPLRTVLAVYIEKHDYLKSGLVCLGVGIVAYVIGFVIAIVFLIEPLQ